MYEFSDKDQINLIRFQNKLKITLRVHCLVSVLFALWGVLESNQ
jgi:hypothetical protein